MQAHFSQGDARVAGKGFNYAFVIGALLVLIAIAFAVERASAQQKTPVAVVGSFFDENGKFPADLQVEAHCPETKEAPIPLIVGPPDPSGAKESLYVLAGKFGEVKCKLVYRTGSKTVLTLIIKISESQTSDVVIMMHGPTNKPNIIINHEQLTFSELLLAPPSSAATRAAVILDAGPAHGSIDCGLYGPHSAEISCSASQHPNCCCDVSFLGWGIAKCTCDEGAAVAKPAEPPFPPAGHWSVITFTSANSGFPDHGFIIVTAPSGAQQQLQDIGAPPWKLAQDVSFICQELSLTCPINGETIAIPWGTHLFVEAGITPPREVTK